ncbi:transposase [Rhodococcus zopfii]
MYPSSSVTDTQWAILEPLLPPPGNLSGRGDNPKPCRRRILDAIFSVVRGGIAWAATAVKVPAGDDGLRRLRPERPVAVWAKYVLALAVEVVKRTADTTGFAVLPRRWVVERTVAWISRHRRCVRDYETRPQNHEAMVHIVMIVTMSRRLARSA